MNSEILKGHFIDWVEKQTKNIFPSNPLLLAAFTEALEITINSKINKIPFVDYYQDEELMQILFRNWKGTCLTLLKTIQSPSAHHQVNISFRGIQLNEYYLQKEELYDILYQLTSQCLR